MNENKLLLVDDEEGIRRVLGISLADSGYEVLPAGDAAEALQIFRRELPAIVLTDIKMPGMDGIELLRRIKAEKPETEVIMITGHGDMDLAIRSLEHEATYFITKPIEDEELEAALGRARRRIGERKKERRYRREVEKMLAEMADKEEAGAEEADSDLAASERREIGRIGNRLNVCLLGLDRVIADGGVADLHRVRDMLEEIAARLKAIAKSGMEKNDGPP